MSKEQSTENNENNTVDDDQSNSIVRPNANYKLSNQSAGNGVEEGITFYYNRERRLESAPDAVKNLYKEDGKKRFGLFGSLVADKFRRTLLVIIVLMCVLTVVLLRMGFFDDYSTLDNNRLDITAIIVEDMTIITINKTVRSQGAYSGAVDIAVSPVASSEDEPYSVFYHRIFFTLENEERYRFAVPFGVPEILMVLQTERSTLQLRLRPE